MEGRGSEVAGDITGTATGSFEFGGGVGRASKACTTTYCTVESGDGTGFAGV